MDDNAISDFKTDKNSLQKAEENSNSLSVCGRAFQSLEAKLE